MDIENLVKYLNNDDVKIRLNSLNQLSDQIKSGHLKKVQPTDFVNNHIHTFYSFSPYSPTKALWMAYNSGLSTAGIMDHDTIVGANEFIEAGKILGVATTIGIECRVDFSKTSLNGKKINNPDQNTVTYIALHGIPHTKINEVKKYFSPKIEERNKRNKLMIENLNKILNNFQISLDFNKDVVPLSKYNYGGAITERHILFALSHKLIDKFGKGVKILDFLKNNLKIKISEKIEKLLSDENNNFYEYDLLGALKSEMVELFYIDATTECYPVVDVIDFANSIGAIPAYAYLGDIGDSITGDKKTQKFEDDFLDLLFEELSKLDFKAITYMPSRNTIDQLKRLKNLCTKFGFFEISGEDINSPRQSFICESLKNPFFNNLIDSTWALIGHEKQSTINLNNGLFSKKIIEKYPDFIERINIYKQFGKD